MGVDASATRPIIWLWGFSVIMVHIPEVTSLSVSVQWNDIPLGGKDIFNVSSADRNWNYKHDKIYNSKYRSEESGVVIRNGAVIMKSSVPCDKIENPSEIQILSSRDNNNANIVSLFPLEISIQGKNCLIPKHRKTHRRRQRDKKYRIIVKSKNFHFNWCFRKHDTVLNFGALLPVTLHKCEKVNFHPKEPISLISFDQKDRSLYALQKFCTPSSRFSVFGHLSVKCSKLSQVVEIPVKIIFKNLLEFQQKSLPSPSQNHHLRIRRQVINNAPKFPQLTYSASVQEKQNPGYHVITVTATDSDSGDNSVITYSMTAQNDQRSKDMFAINPVTGLVNTTVMLDRELIPKHTFAIYATDNGYPQLSAMALLTITVLDINDNDPKFEQSVYYQEVAENLPVSSTIMTIKATDSDEGRNAEIRYRIIENQQSSAFMIEPITGTITTRAVLDRESNASYQILVQATDQGDVANRRSSTATVNIAVLDENDNYPQFSQKTYLVNVSEDYNFNMNLAIAKVSATDRDLDKNGQITYNIFGGNTFDTFRIDAVTGEISVQKQLDYETTKEYRLSIQAQDQGEPPKTNTTDVIIKVIDVNDNSPIFHAAPYRGNVPEDAPINSTAVAVQAQDRDDGLNSLLVYSIVNPDENLPFWIDSATGDVKVKSKLDHEKHESYNFVVMAKDQGTPVKSDTTSVFVTVRDINDNAPVFSQKIYNQTVSESTATTTRIISVSASDEDSNDNAYITYSIVSGNVGNTFQISTINGEGMISLQRKLNYKEQAQYLLEVRGTDLGGLYDTAQVRIYVLDTNKYRPQFQHTPYKIEVRENVPVGSSIYRVLAVDQDVGENGRVAYRLGQGTSGFEIDENTGDIKTRVKLDRETTPSMSFAVEAHDHGQPSMSTVVMVHVIILDENDNVPRFTHDNFTGSIVENAEVDRSVMQISATDEDKGNNAKISYSLVHSTIPPSDHFSIDPVSGVIRVAQKLDRETVAVYNLKAVATDGGVPPRSSTVGVRINIIDINDNPPKFPSKELEIRVPENTPVGSVLMKVSATDPDEGENAQVEYEKIPGLDADKFDLSYRPGEPAILKNRVDFDYEQGPRIFYVKIYARSNPFFEDATLVIMIQDVNDNKPELKDFSIIFNNFEEHFVTGPIGRIPATDPDEIDQNKLRYEILGGNEAHFLDLNTSTGELTLDYRLNSDVPRNGTLQVKVSDGMNEKRATCRLYVRLVTKEMLEKSVTIRLNNITQNTFLSPLYKFFVDALASVLKTEEKNIYVINVENDTDVSTTVLNVSVAVRKADGSFYDAEVLKEQIYLQRIRLAELSTLQVLPFEDNICIREFCANFEHCIFYVKFGRPRPFIHSDMMLFRPIHPVNSFRCECPSGYAMTTGDYCNMEIDACYSSPCKNGGQCKRKEGGYTCLCAPNFTGETCEINTRKQFDILTCPQNVCQSPSECEANQNQGGFQCKGCPAEPHYDKYCQLTTRSFAIGSYLTFPAFKRRFRFNIQLKFATQMKDGLLFYNGRFNDRNDFMALEIVDGQLQFSFSTGTNKTSVRSKVEGGVSNGEWQFVQVDYINRTVTLSVGEECDTQIGVKYGHLISDHPCAVQTTFEIPDICYTNVVPQVQCPKFLDLNGPLQIGGLPNLQTQFQTENRNYKGCIKDFYIDHKLLDLNKFVLNQGTVAGCAEKTNQCISAPCKHGGTCHDRWGTYFCECPDRAGGKDCSQVIDQPTRLEGNGFLLYTENSLTSKTILYAWYNGISFRTRASSGVLMYIVISEGYTITLELVEGYAQYHVSGANRTFVFDYLPVNDGKWHYLEVRWPRNWEIILVMDYGHWQKKENITVLLSNKIVDRVYVGAKRENDGPISKGFVGCVENIIVGNTNTALLSRPSHSNTYPGCTIPSACMDNPCSAGATCVDQWGKHECVCPKGTLGPQCKDICRNYNPCHYAAICHGPTFNPSSQAGYTCQCGQLQSGRYCEYVSTQPCDDGWYGFPVCGPCNCSYELGFDTKCNKTDGTCFCQENYYRPIGSDRCFPCDCYKYGSTSIYCDKVTGQCPCKKNVIGRKCDQCENKYAHISWNPNDDIGCLVTNSMCPRQFYKIMWWEAKTFTESGYVTAVQDCPFGAVGDAKRNCSKTELWSEPDLFNCTNKDFVSLETQVSQMENRTLNITTYVAKTMAAKLASATSSVRVLFGNDINITYRIINQLLKYENKQSGLGLTLEQDSNYLQHLLDALSTALDPQYVYEWNKINRRSGGIGEIFYRLENYLDLLTRNLDRMQKNPYRVVSKHIVLSVDTLTSRNTTGLKIPKFDNIVAESTFDDQTHVVLPPSISQSSVAEYIQRVMSRGSDKFYVSYMLFNTLGSLLPSGPGSLHTSIVQNPGRELAVNSPVFSLLLRDQDCAINKGFSEPLKFHFKQKVKDNRTSPQCVYWKTPNSDACNHTDTTGGTSYLGQWSSEGCTVDRRYEIEISGQGSQVTKDMYVVCSCNHLTSFSILMEVADSEYTARAVISLAIFSFVGIGISLVCLFVSFVIFCSFKRLQCNSNSILINIVFTLFVAELAFIAGVYRVSSKLICRLVAICLHYFYLAAFSWLFVEMLHLYRRLIEIRDINYGTMKFYYLLGYVIPGIIVGLSVGLYTDGYGNTSFCWMDISETFIWSFAGPVAVVIPAIIFMFTLALHSSCKEKVNVSDITAFRARIFSGVILLLLLGISWILGLLSVNYDLQPLHYVYAAFTFLQGAFVFLAYVVGDKKVRYNLKKQWYKMQGKKLDPDDSVVGSRPSISRSALAYRRDSSIDGYINRTNVGISTTSTTSRSTSKSSGGLYKGEDYLRSTDTSTSGHAPSYAYDNSYHQKSGEDEVPERRSHRKHRNHDSDSESDVSVGQASIELASSHSSDEDDDFDIGPSWEKQLPKNQKIEEAKEQMKRKQQQEQSQHQDSEQQQNQQNLKHLHSGPHLYTTLPNYGHWPGDPNLSGFHMSESDYQQTVSSNPPDVTLPAQQDLQDAVMRLQSDTPAGSSPHSIHH
ncbi:cadherin EGF LAG seven-pass G-type receptor 2-like isoform X2 [Saccostrea echinata]|uniref:cadherin EGF LAG seven-pass G-type receptor 2-like isoform X2 n=1 Tax=Saccostrea echinata TaxID=191078 RepID=UPI002A8346B6|nr:cadherin EGF LAG seven-pass G-type receptor 2-like isoform X2 [Saccostrea echinata]